MVWLKFFNAGDNPDHVWPPGHRTPQTYLTAPSSHNEFYNAHACGDGRLQHPHGRRLYAELPGRCTASRSTATCPSRRCSYTNIRRSGSTIGRTTARGSRSREPSMMTRGMRTASIRRHGGRALEASMDVRKVVARRRSLERVGFSSRRRSWPRSTRSPMALWSIATAVPRWHRSPRSSGHASRDLNWPYAMGAAHLDTYPLLKEIAESDLGLSGLPCRCVPLADKGEKRSGDVARKRDIRGRRYGWGTARGLGRSPAPRAAGTGRARKGRHTAVDWKFGAGVRPRLLSRGKLSCRLSKAYEVSI